MQQQQPIPIFLCPPMDDNDDEGGDGLPAPLRERFNALRNNKRKWNQEDDNDGTRVRLAEQTAQLVQSELLRWHNSVAELEALVERREAQQQLSDYDDDNDNDDEEEENNSDLIEALHRDNGQDNQHGRLDRDNDNDLHGAASTRNQLLFEDDHVPILSFLPTVVYVPSDDEDQDEETEEKCANGKQQS